MERKEQELYREIYLNHQHIFENGNGNKIPICYRVENIYSSNNSNLRNDTLKYTIFYNKECTDYKEFIISLEYHHKYNVENNDEDDEDDDDDDENNIFKKYKKEKNEFYKYLNTRNTIY